MKVTRKAMRTGLRGRLSGRAAETGPYPPFKISHFLDGRRWPGTFGGQRREYGSTPLLSLT